MAQKNAKKLEDYNKQADKTLAEKEEMLKKSRESRSNAKPGSLAARANMVKDYNEGKK